MFSQRPSLLVRVFTACLFLAAPFLSLAQSTTPDRNGSDNVTASFFFSPDNDLAFALNVPSNSSTDLYFTLLLAGGISWGAVGLGSSSMAGSLMLMVYGSESGRNVTISPRRATGHREPVFDPEIRVDALDGTGIVNGSTLVFNGRCTNCRSWISANDGDARRLDVGSTAAPFIYATGPGRSLRSDNPAQDLQSHYSYGTFSMDLVRATGPAGVPGPGTGRLEGATLGISETGKSDTVAKAHAILMVLVFVGLYPLGVLILRLGNWTRWHAGNQILGLVLVVLAVGLGSKASGTYNRSKNFNSAHQILGLLIFIALLAMPVLGHLNHRAFRNTGQSTKMAPIHVWLGRAIILVGVINAFLGFRLAQSGHWNLILGGLVAFIFPAVAVILATKAFLRRRFGSDNKPAGYDMQPWQPAGGYPQHTATATAGDPPQPPPATWGGTGLGMSQQPGRGVTGLHPGGGPGGLGPQQATREYV